MAYDQKDIIIPAPLRQGDRIAVVSPAGPVEPYYVMDACKVLEAEGWKPEIGKHALGRWGNYAGTPDERYSDLRNAILDPDVKAVLCSRGGYGVVHIMERLAQLDLRNNPKWMIGFSDISAIHALMATHGIASIHASMAKHIAKGPEDPDNATLFSILRGKTEPVSFPSHILDRPGTAQGRLLGGNLAVLADLINTPFDIIRPDTVLFIEDVAEPIYKIERILYQMRIAGILPRLAGLIVGQFTEYKADNSYNSMERMISDMVQPYNFPVAFNVPVGHVEHNIPMLESARVTLKVTPPDSNHLIKRS